MHAGRIQASGVRGQSCAEGTQCWFRAVLVDRAWEGDGGQGVGLGQCPEVPGQPEIKMVFTLLTWDEGRGC